MRIKAIPLAISAIFATAGHAADSGEATITLGEVSVHGTAGPLTTHSILTSVDILGGDQVATKNVANSW